MIHFVTPLKPTVSSRSFVSSGRDSYSSKSRRRGGNSKGGVYEEHWPLGTHFNENLEMLCLLECKNPFEVEQPGFLKGKIVIWKAYLFTKNLQYSFRAVL